MPRDRWEKKLSSGETVLYTSEITPGYGGVISARKGAKVQTVSVDKPLSREEVEAVFNDI
jgi:hypothetical protein